MEFEIQKLENQKRQLLEQQEPKSLPASSTEPLHGTCSAPQITTDQLWAVCGLGRALGDLVAMPRLSIAPRTSTVC